MWEGCSGQGVFLSSVASLIALAGKIRSQRISPQTMNKRVQLTWPVNLLILKLIRKKKKKKRVLKPLCTDILVSEECSDEGICMLLYFGLRERMDGNMLTRTKKKPQSLQLLYDILTQHMKSVCLKFSRSMLYILCVEAQTHVHQFPATLNTYGMKCVG